MRHEWSEPMMIDLRKPASRAARSGPRRAAARLVAIVGGAAVLGAVSVIPTRR